MSCQIREAIHADVPEVVADVGRLLEELSGHESDPESLERIAHALIDNPEAGALLVAESDGQIVGILGASWQIAIRVAGRYGLIQELWVHPDWRSRALGAELIDALVQLARVQGIERLEVGLPSARFAQLAATEAFYLDNGFDTIGSRMRRILS
jgi:branched-chain amino acid aminotransferase